MQTLVTQLENNLQTQAEKTGMKMPEDLEMSELISEVEECNYLLEQIQAAISVYKTEMMNRLDQEKINATIVGNWVVKKITRTNLDVDLDRARELGAVKMKEVIDTEMLNAMQAKGAQLPVKVVQFIDIKEVKKDE